LHRLLVVVLALVVVPAASAAFSVTLTTGNVTLPGVTLSGVDQTQTFTLSITVNDANPGGGNGWNLSMAATAPTLGAYAMPALVVTNVASAGCTGGSCVNPTNSISWPLTVTSGGVKFYNAAVGTGTRSDVLTATVKFTYAAGAPAGTYVSTLTVTGINNGP
jgi:hypothetical protein